MIFKTMLFKKNRFITGETLGLQNIGATCYMNVTLQCLFHIKELSSYFLNWYYSKYGSYIFNQFLFFLMRKSYLNSI